MTAAERPRVSHLLGGLAVFLVLLGPVSSARAGLLLSTTPNFPTSALVGASGLAAGLTMSNNSTAPESSGNVTISAITLVPSCGSFTFADCPAASVDPGVFSLPATGVGAAGSACAGVTFTLTTIDSNQGKLALNPSATVVLGPPGGASATCRIDFAIGVTRLPAKDSDPGAGLQTAELGAVSGTASATGASGSAFGTSETTVSRGNPGIATQVASAAAKPGDSVTDLASLTASPGSPAPTGTVTFKAYGSSDATCAAAPVFTSTNAINGAFAQSSAFTLPSVGTYRFIATYNGDGANNPGSTSCNDANEAVVVKAQPSISTHVAAPSVAVGATISDTATMTPQPGQPAPTGSVTFRIYGPGDTACATPLSTVTASLSGATATSAPPAFTATTAGVYRFTAKYEGDASNSPVSGACNDANEQVTVGSDELPTVSYTPSTYTPHAGQTVTFTGSASDPDGTITSYVWKWGDGTPDGSGATATHVFTVEGLHSVGLYVTDSAGQTAAVGHGITVGDELPTVSYTPSTYTPHAGQAVTFTGSASDPDGSITSYVWKWGDGTPDGSGATATHVFTVEGIHSVGLYVTDSAGQTAAVGHGITVGDELPTVSYSPSTYTPPGGQTVTFTASASDPDGSITSYVWKWGDGTPDGSGATATHVFTVEGLHSVGLYVTDSAGQTAAVGHGITVGDELPAVAYTPSTYTPTVGQTVTFTGSASDPDGSITSYVWKWGDGTPDGSGPTATHSFATPGVRSVGLYVTDSAGRTNAVGHGITVTGGA